MGDIGKDREGGRQRRGAGEILREEAKIGGGMKRNM